MREFGLLFFQHSVEPGAGLGVVQADPGVVHQDVQPGELFVNAVEHGDDLPAFGDVRLHRQPAFLLAAFLQNFLRRFRRQVVTNNRRPFLGETQADRPADPGRAAGD